MSARELRRARDVASRTAGQLLRVRRTRARSLFAAAAFFACCCGAPAVAEGAPAEAADGSAAWLGRPLSEALEDLLDQGLRLVYSSDLIRPEMRVLDEPTASSLHARLEQLLAPHGLTGQVGPEGHLLVVRRQAGAPLDLRLLAPRPDEITAGQVDVEAMILGDEPVDRLELYVDGKLRAQLAKPPWRAALRLDGESSEWQIAAVARGAWGGVDRADVRTRGVVFRDRVEVAMREVFVTVTDRAGFAGELQPSHFRIVDRGVEVVPAAIDRAELPWSAAVLLDTSESMESALAASAAGAKAFLRRLAPADEAALLLFSDRLRALTGFGREPARLESVLADLDADGGTALNDHLYAALRLVESRAGWPIVVLLSDGADLLSALSMAEVRWKIDASEAAIYWLRLGGATAFSRGVSSAWRDAAANARELAELEDAVGASGGRVLELADPDEVARAFDAIHAELQEQYVLSYAPPPPSGASLARGRAVAVRSTLPGLRLLASAKDFALSPALTP